MSIHEEILQIHERLVQDKTKYDLLQSKKEKLESELTVVEERYEHLLKTRALIQEAAQQTQQKIEFHVSNLVTMALATVWEDPYEFKLEFVKRRGSTEADIWFVRNMKKAEPMESSGGGPKDIAAFALRIGYWSLKKSTRSIMIIDEPFCNLARPLQEKAADMLRMLSDRLGLQIICATHIDALKDCADKQFEVALINGESVVHEKILKKDEKRVDKG